jgi:hypothetical protein
MFRRLKMMLSNARLRCRETKLIYPNHRRPPWLTARLQERTRYHVMAVG